ncbi:hypothetical protein DSECCO2_630970 [anaerobic digester metagenome]
MEELQARGYVFEKVIWDLLEEAGYVSVTTGLLEGRGARHQIDAYGTLKIPTAFTYPIRLLAEAKCYNGTAGLETIRNFFGVVQDISENYVVGKDKERNTPHRYLDAGCIFSAGSYSRDAQDYAWAHNIFLVSFSGIEKMTHIVTGIKQFVSGIDSDILKSLEKKDLVEKFKCFQTTAEYFNDTPTLVVGIVDNAYPVILVGDKGWIDEIRIPSDTDQISGVKISRSAWNGATIFNLDLNGQRVCFNLPNGIAQKLIERIDRTSDGDKIFELDIPLKRATHEATVRRIMKIDISLPDKSDYCRTISPPEEKDVSKMVPEVHRPENVLIPPPKEKEVRKRRGRFQSLEF